MARVGAVYLVGCIFRVNCFIVSNRLNDLRQLKEQFLFKGEALLSEGEVQVWRHTVQQVQPIGALAGRLLPGGLCTPPIPRPDGIMRCEILRTATS